MNTQRVNGIVELGIVGTAAAANTFHHATGKTLWGLLYTMKDV